MTATGDAEPLQTRRLAALAYAGWWVTGLLVWMVVPADRFVRFHAVQSVVALGAAFLAWIACLVASFALLTVSAAGFGLLQRVSLAVLVAGCVLWATCVWQAWHGRWWRVPLAGRLVERLAGRRR